MGTALKTSVAVALFFLPGNLAMAQTQPAQTAAAPQAVPQIVQQASTMHIAVNVYDQNTNPVANLTAGDFQLMVDGKPASFHLSRPWDSTLDAKTGKPVDRPNLLILLPYGAPTLRSDAMDEVVRYFDKVDSFDWNVSIMDDTGKQTPYTTDLQQIRKDMHAVAKDNPDYSGVDMYSWRRKASLAIENMRDLPGRRVVMSLGDIFHEQIYTNFTLVYDNFEAHDVAGAARSSGAFIYAAESFQEMGRIRGLWPYYYTLGFGPWLLLDENNQVEGWISNFVTDTIHQIQQDRDASYVLDMPLTPEQMDGGLHRIHVGLSNPKLLLSAPAFYAAPNRADLMKIADSPAYLQNALLHPGADSTLVTIPRVDYFPSATESGGDQIISLGFFWNANTPPPNQLYLLAQLVQSNTGLSDGVIRERLLWTGDGPVLRFAARVFPGAYLLTVAASDAGGHVVSSASYPFTVAPRGNDPVLMSSLVVGKACAFVPQTVEKSPQNTALSNDLLLAGHCVVGPDPIGYFSPRDVLWTLVRMTPTGKFSDRPPSSWKGRFTLRDEKGKVLEEQPVAWIDQGHGNYVATVGLPLSSDKLTNGDYAVALELSGPGLGRDYYEDSIISLYGFPQSGNDNNKGKGKHH